MHTAGTVAEFLDVGLYLFGLVRVTLYNCHVRARSNLTGPHRDVDGPLLSHEMPPRVPAQ